MKLGEMTKKYPKNRKGGAGLSNKGIVRSAEFRKKVSLGMKGVNTWSKGRKQTEETKRKIGMSNTGKKHNAEWIENVRRSLKGKYVREKNPNWKGGSYTYEQRNRRKKYIHLMPDKCEICGIPGESLKKGLYVDHNHKTGEFRGFLCRRCNTTLGFVNDSPDLLLELINYLKKHI